MSSMPKDLAPENGKLALATALFESYRYQIRCPDCSSTPGKSGHTLDTYGRSPGDVTRRRFRCQKTGGSCAALTCTRYISAAENQLLPTQFARKVDETVARLKVLDQVTYVSFLTANYPSSPACGRESLQGSSSTLPDTPNSDNRRISTRLHSSTGRTLPNSNTLNGSSIPLARVPSVSVELAGPTSTSLELVPFCQASPSPQHEPTTTSRRKHPLSPSRETVDPDSKRQRSNGVASDSHGPSQPSDSSTEDFIPDLYPDLRTFVAMTEDFSNPAPSRDDMIEALKFYHAMIRTESTLLLATHRRIGALAEQSSKFIRMLEDKRIHYLQPDPLATLVPTQTTFEGVLLGTADTQTIDGLTILYKFATRTSNHPLRHAIKKRAKYLRLYGHIMERIGLEGW